MFKSSGKSVGISTDGLSLVIVMDFHRLCAIWYRKCFSLIQTTSIETSAAVQKWACRPAAWTKISSQVNTSSVLRRGLSSACRHFPESVCMCVWSPRADITRSLCHIYFGLSRCSAVKLPPCHWLKQWTCLCMIGWNQLLHCGISRFCFLMCAATK